MKGLSRVEKWVYFIVGFLILAFLAGLVEVQLFVAGKGRLAPIFKILLYVSPSILLGYYLGIFKRNK